MPNKYLQNQNTVSAYFKSKQLLSFDFGRYDE